ncbi:hypothetical protein HDU96_004490 [Phlyctochytrium bullatum]|nr:hypothetical protein HDU96_004490 [Phlyctochytrium bullatum]
MTKTPMLTPLANPPPLALSAEADEISSQRNTPLVAQIQVFAETEVPKAFDEATDDKLIDAIASRSSLRNPSNESFFLDGSDLSVDLMAESAPTAISTSSSAYFTTSTSLDTFKDAASILSEETKPKSAVKKDTDIDLLSLDRSRSPTPFRQRGSSSHRLTIGGRELPEVKQGFQLGPLKPFSLDEILDSRSATRGGDSDDESFSEKRGQSKSTPIPAGGATDALSSGEKEIDPNASIWIMAFDSPPKGKDGSNRTNAKKAVLGIPPLAKPNILDELENERQSPKTVSLLDMQNVFSTPQSIPKYTERDMERLKTQLTAQFEKEFEIIQLEIQELESKRAHALESNRKLQATLADWEKFIRETIAQKEQTELKARAEISKLTSNLEKVALDRERLAEECNSLQSKLQKAKVDAEAEKEASFMLSLTPLSFFEVCVAYAV